MNLSVFNRGQFPQTPLSGFAVIGRLGQVRDRRAPPSSGDRPMPVEDVLLQYDKERFHRSVVTAEAVAIMIGSPRSLADVREAMTF